MKRIIAALICAITVLSLFSCAAPQSDGSDPTGAAPIVILTGDGASNDPSVVTAEATGPRNTEEAPATEETVENRIFDPQMCLREDLAKIRRESVGDHLESLTYERASPSFYYYPSKQISRGDLALTCRFSISENGMRTNLLYTYRNKGAYHSLYKDEWWFEDMNAFWDIESFLREISLREGRDELFVADGSIVNSRLYGVQADRYWQEQAIIRVFSAVRDLKVTKKEFVRANDARAKINLRIADSGSDLWYPAIPTFSDATVDALFSSSSAEEFSRRMRAAYTFTDPEDPQTFYSEAELEILVLDAFGPGSGSQDADKAEERKELRERIAALNKNGALARHFEAAARNQENSLEWLLDQYIDTGEDYGCERWILKDESFEPGHDLMINCALDIVIPLFNSLFPDDPDLRIQTDEFWDALCFTADELLTLPAVRYTEPAPHTLDPWYAEGLWKN